MTPAAMTPAAARTAKRSRAHASPAPTRKRPAPASPRRVSGPVPAQRAERHVAPVHDRALDFVRGLPDHSLLDRLVRGRTWILLLGVMLAGIVAMQVEVLKLNASMGRSLALSSTLQSRNEQLRASVSSLSDAQRIERLASGMGMVMPGPTSVSFLDARRVAPGQAAAAIQRPDATAFESALQTSVASTPATTTGAATPSAAGATASPPTAGAGATPATATAPATSTATSTASTASATSTANPPASPSTTATATATPSTGGATGAQPTTGGTGAAAAAGAPPGR